MKCFPGRKIKGINGSHRRRNSHHDESVAGPKKDHKKDHDQWQEKIILKLHGNGPLRLQYRAGRQESESEGWMRKFS